MRLNRSALRIVVRLTLPALFVACCVLGSAGALAAEAKSLTLDEVKAKRLEARKRQRRIIFDNDGNEVVYKLGKATPEALLAARTTPVVGTQVDTIMYCTWSSGFGYFTHNTKVGEVFDCTVKGFSKNKTRDFIEQGTDALEIVTNFCRKKGIEIFWSMRMNDTHDAWGGWYSPYLFPKIKKDHPEWLMGTKEKRPKNGAWSAVNFGVPEVRDYAYKFFEEVCNNYDVDGVQMDFLRHLTYFKCHAWGKDAGPEQWQQMTSLVRRIREMADRRGAERGRPILLAVRVMDSVPYCKGVGLDIETWLKEGLVDVLVVSGYFRMNPWPTSVELGHKYGVPVYPCLSETRVRDKIAKKPRGSLACYRGRAMNVWQSGADGVYLFNYFNVKSPLWKQLGSPATIKPHERMYCTGARNIAALNRWYTGAKKWHNRCLLMPTAPRKLSQGKPVSIEITIGEDLSKAPASTKLELQLRFKGVDQPDVLAVEVNGAPVKGTKPAKSPYLLYAVDPKAMKLGTNQITVVLEKQAKGDVLWQDALLWVRPGKGSE